MDNTLEAFHVVAVKAARGTVLLVEVRAGHNKAASIRSPSLFIFTYNFLGIQKVVEHKGERDHKLHLLCWARLGVLAG